MITLLDDAWRWYERARALALTAQRLAAKHWDELPWEGSLGRDERLNDITAKMLTDQSATVLEDLDDLGVLLLFSVFEARVRTQVLTEIKTQLPQLQHPALGRAVADLQEEIGSGSFFKVLQPYKQFDADLVETVNQVRRYRNWVAHGRHADRPDAVESHAAYDRLQRFLDSLGNFVTPAATDVSSG